MRKIKLFLLTKIQVTGKVLSRLFMKPWLKAYAGLTINLSAAFFIGSFIGPNISIPRSTFDFAILSGNVIAGIMFLLAAVRLEKELLK